MKHSPRKCSHVATLVLAILACAAMTVACRHNNGDHNDNDARIKCLRQLSDSVSAQAPDVVGKIKKRIKSAKDSMTYYEYKTILARYYSLADSTQEADTLVDGILKFAKQQCDKNNSPRARALYATALNVRAALNHHFHRNPKETVELYKKAFELLPKSDCEYNMPKVCANLADAYIQANDIPMGAKYYRHALFLVDSLQLPKSENITLYMGLAQIYMSLHDFRTADTYYKETEKCLNMMSPSMQSYYLNNVGNMYYYSKEYKKALKAFLRMKRHLEKQGMLNNFDMYLCKINLADVYLNLGDTQKAQACLNEAEPYFRKVGDETATYYCNTIRIGLAMHNNNTGEVDHIISGEHIKNDIPYQMVNVRNAYLQKYYEQKGNFRMAFYNMQKDQRYTDSLEHNRANMRSAEILARFTADTLQLHHELAIEHKNADIQRANLNMTIAIAAAIIMLSLLAIWMMYTRKKQAQNQISIMNLKLLNVRNRISPHFMFNVLNNKIIKSDEKEASELMELARLIRTNLDMSSRPCVELSKEIDFVKKYIDVERYLLGDSFVFKLNVEKNFDTSTVQIPAMFLQILTENAIVHGLKGLEGEKRLVINVTRQQQNTVISVTDNGPGFNAQAIKKKTGLGIISQTIAVTNEHNKNKMRFNIRNITDSNGNILGCMSELKVPDNVEF